MRHFNSNIIAKWLIWLSWKATKKWVSSFNNFFGHVIGRNAFTGGVFFAQSLEWIEFDITDDRLANNSLTICSFDHSHSIFNELNLLFLTVLLFKVGSKSNWLSKLALWIARDSWICRMRTNTFLLKKKMDYNIQNSISLFPS